MLLYCQVSKNPVKTKGFADLVLRKNAKVMVILSKDELIFIFKKINLH